MSPFTTDDTEWLFVDGVPADELEFIHDIVTIDTPQEEAVNDTDRSTLVKRIVVIGALIYGVLYYISPLITQ